MIASNVSHVRLYYAMQRRYTYVLHEHSGRYLWVCTFCMVLCDWVRITCYAVHYNVICTTPRNNVPLDIVSCWIRYTTCSRVQRNVGSSRNAWLCMSCCRVMPAQYTGNHTCYTHNVVSSYCCQSFIIYTYLRAIKNADKHACRHTGIYAHTNAYMYMYTCVYTYVPTHVYIHTHIRMHASHAMHSARTYMIHGWIYTSRVHHS